MSNQVSYAKVDTSGGGGSSSSNNAYDFVVNMEKLDELRKQLDSAASKIEDEVVAIYEAIYNLGSGKDGKGNGPWLGDSYEAFKSKCEESKPALESLALIIRAYGKMIDNQVFIEANELVANVSKNLSLGE